MLRKLSIFHYIAIYWSLFSAMSTGYGALFSTEKRSTERRYMKSMTILPHLATGCLRLIY